MNPEIKQKWLDDLKSGQYKKGTQRLKKDNGEKALHCCLGVLCEIHRTETGYGEWKIGTYDEMHYIVPGGETSCTGLVSAVMEWSGIGSVSGSFEPDKEDINVLLDAGFIETRAHVNLSHINDHTPDSDFKHIIPLIEKYF